MCLRLLITERPQRLDLPGLEHSTEGNRSQRLVGCLRSRPGSQRVLTSSILLQVYAKSPSGPMSGEAIVTIELMPGYFLFLFLSLSLSSPSLRCHPSLCSPGPPPSLPFLFLELHGSLFSVRLPPRQVFKSPRRLGCLVCARVVVDRHGATRFGRAGICRRGTRDW